MEDQTYLLYLLKFLDCRNHSPKKDTLAEVTVLKKFITVKQRRRPRRESRDVVPRDFLSAVGIPYAPLPTAAKEHGGEHSTSSNISQLCNLTSPACYLLNI